MANLEPGDGPKKRVKIFTVHGTFAHETEWDNWDDKDDKATPADERSFTNRLGQYLGETGVAFDKADHTQYNWSGGNSHDERRTAAIGLRQFIQHDLSGTLAKHGKDYKDYYDGGVFVIAHSHGGTISRMAMNLWDMEKDEYYVEDSQKTNDLFHDDKCPVCKQHRNGEAVPDKTIARPDGIITFGSPFVHFKRRKTGLLAARLLAWALIVPGFVATALYYVWVVFKSFSDANQGVISLPFQPKSPYGIEFIDAILKSQFVQTGIHLLWPAALYWLFAIYIPSRFLATVERIFGKKKGILFTASAITKVIRPLGLAALAAYYLAYAFPGLDSIRPFMESLAVAFPLNKFWFWFPLVVFWLLAISLPRRLLRWVKTEVAGLRDELPKKYDPVEGKDQATQYLSYHTPGDEAGLGLHIFGAITWLVQTLWLTVAMVMAVGLATVLLIAIGTALSDQGLSGLPGFILVMDALTLYPILVWKWVIGLFIPGTQMFSLGGLANSGEVAKNVPLAFVTIMGTVLVMLIPLILAATGIANIVSYWLRGSGLAFGSERFAWTLANNISVGKRPSIKTKMKTVLISPEAWWNGEVAHSFYYKCDRVIRDVAGNIADWRNVKPDPASSLGPAISRALRWFVVLFFVLSMFMLAVQGAKDGVDAEAAAAAEAAKPAQVPAPAKPIAK